MKLSEKQLKHLELEANKIIANVAMKKLDTSGLYAGSMRLAAITLMRELHRIEVENGVDTVARK